MLSFNIEETACVCLVVVNSVIPLQEDVSLCWSCMKLHFKTWVPSECLGPLCKPFHSNGILFGAPLQTLSQQWCIVWGPFANPFTAMVYCLGPLCKPFHGNCVESHCYNILPKFYCKRQLEMDILKQLYWYFNTEHNIGPHQLRQIWKNLVICFLHC